MMTSTRTPQSGILQFTTQQRCAPFAGMARIIRSHPRDACKLLTLELITCSATAAGGEELIDAPIDTAGRNRSFAGVISAQGYNWTPVERKVAQVMADTGESRQIIGRSNAKEAETVRASKRVVSEARSTAKASNAAFGATEKGSRRRVKGSGQRSSDPKASKT
jgi:hypothetical protein